MNDNTNFPLNIILSLFPFVSLSSFFTFNPLGGGWSSSWLHPPTHQHLARPTADPLWEEVDGLYMAKVCERLMAMAIEWEEAKMHNNPWSRGQNLPMVDAHLAEVKNIDDKRKLGTKKTVKAHREEKPRSKVLPPHRQPSTISDSLPSVTVTSSFPLSDILSFSQFLYSTHALMLSSFKIFIYPLCMKFPIWSFHGKGFYFFYRLYRIYERFDLLVYGSTRCILTFL